MLHFVPAKVNRRDTSKDRYGDAHSPLFGDELFHNAGKVLEWSFEDEDTISALEMFGPAHVLFSNRLTKAISRDAEMPEKFCGPRLSGLHDAEQKMLDSDVPMPQVCGGLERHSESLFHIRGKRHLAR